MDKHLFAGLGVFLVLMFSGIALAGPPPYEPGIVLETPVSTEDALCRGYYQDQETEDGTLEFEWYVEDSVVDVQTYSDVPPDSTVDSYLDSGFYDQDDYLACNLTAINSGGENTTLLDTVVETSIPQVQELEFHNYSEAHAYNVSAVVADLEGDHVLEECRLQASNSTVSQTYVMDLDRSYGDDTQASCFYSNISENDFPVLETVNNTLFIEDNSDNVGNHSLNNTVPNNPPEIFGVRPEDDSRTSGGEIDLQANFIDRDGDEMEVVFYSSQASPEIICEETLMEGTVECTWTDIESMQDYQWNINVSDSYQNVSQAFDFRNIVASEVKAVTGFDHRYSSLILTVGTAQTVMYTVENNHDSVKHLTSTVEGPNAEFVLEGSDQVSYTLPPDETERLEIRVSPNSAGSDTLKITTENDDYDIVNEDSMGVFTRNQASTVPDVPGLGLLQLLVLLLVSTVYYSVRP